MSNRRRKSQVSATIWMEQSLKDCLQAELRKRRLGLSQFMRDAIAEKMDRDFGIEVPEEVVVPQLSSSAQVSSDDISDKSAEPYFVEIVPIDPPKKRKAAE